MIWLLFSFHPFQNIQNYTWNFKIDSSLLPSPFPGLRQNNFSSMFLSISSWNLSLCGRQLLAWSPVIPTFCYVSSVQYVPLECRLTFNEYNMAHVIRFHFWGLVRKRPGLSQDAFFCSLSDCSFWKSQLPCIGASMWKWLHEWAWKPFFWDLPTALRVNLERDLILEILQTSWLQICKRP